MKPAMENRDPALCRAFVKRARELFQDNPRAKHSWSVDADEDHCILDIPEQAAEGFSVTVQAFADEIILSAGGAHCHFDAKAGIESCVETVLGLVRDLLSPQMRVRELRSNNRPYRWYIEVWNGEQWLAEEEYGYFFWNYFGRKAERHYQNHVLKSRLISD